MCCTATSGTDLDIATTVSDNTSLTSAPQASGASTEAASASGTKSDAPVCSGASSQPQEDTAGKDTTAQPTCASRRAPPAKRRAQFKRTRNGRKIVHIGDTFAKVQDLHKLEDIGINQTYNNKRWTKKKEVQDQKVKAATYPPNTLVRAFRYVFDNYDSNHDGLITTYQLLQALNFMEVKIIAKELSDLLKKIEFDPSQELTFDDFLYVLTTTKHNFSSFLIPGEKPMFSMRSDPLFQSIMKAVQCPQTEQPGKQLDPFTASYIQNYRKRKHREQHTIGSHMNSVKNIGYVGSATERRMKQIERESKIFNDIERFKTYSKAPYNPSLQFNSHVSLMMKKRMSSDGQREVSHEKPPIYKKPLGRTVNTDETAGGTWHQPSVEAAVIKTNPRKLSQFAPYDALSLNEFEKVREQTTSERKMFLEEMRRISDSRSLDEWKKVCPGLIYPTGLRERFRRTYAAYSNLNPETLPMPKTTRMKKAVSQ